MSWRERALHILTQVPDGMWILQRFESPMDRNQLPDLEQNGAHAFSMLGILEIAPTVRRKVRGEFRDRSPILLESSSLHWKTNARHPDNRRLILVGNLPQGVLIHLDPHRPFTRGGPEASPKLRIRIAATL